MNLVRSVPHHRHLPFPLGRHVNHDERSRSFPAPGAAKVGAVSHRRWIGPLDQGQLGSCTGNGLVGCIATTPTYVKGTAKKLDERLAVTVYSRATEIDPFGGQWPPDDTGSDGLSACKAAVEMGLCGSYTHAFGLDHLLAALMERPVMVGINWYESMFTPSPDGVVRISGQVAGGHEVEVYSYDARRRRFGLWNSWGPGWGLNGRFLLEEPDMDRLLREQGDCTVPMRKGA